MLTIIRTHLMLYFRHITKMNFSSLSFDFPLSRKLVVFRLGMGSPRLKQRTILCVSIRFVLRAGTCSIATSLPNKYMMIIDLTKKDHNLIADLAATSDWARVRNAIDNTAELKMPCYLLIH